MSALLRYVLLFVSIMLPLLARAQFAKEYVPGSYVLTQDSTQPLTGSLRLKSDRKLLVVTPPGQQLRFWPAQVQRFQLGAQTYGVIRQVKNYWLAKADRLEQVFAERIDSGRVTLWHHASRHNTGAGWLWLYRPTVRKYRLQVGRGVAQPFAECRRCDAPYTASCVLCVPLQQRPDLLQLLHEGRVTEENMPAFVRALNHGGAFAP